MEISHAGNCFQAVIFLNKILKWSITTKDKFKYFSHKESKCCQCAQRITPGMLVVSSLVIATVFPEDFAFVSSILESVASFFRFCFIFEYY